jgi:hypothetical protein
MTHPFGEDRATRIDQWRILAEFGKPGDRWTEIARLVALAAEAPDDETMRTLAVQALGLHGPKKALANLERLSGALDDLTHIAYAIYARVGSTKPVDPGARGRLDAVHAEGVASWLYRAVKGTAAHGDRATQVRFLKRTADTDPDIKGRLAWALDLEPTTPIVRNSRGRVR